MRSVCVAAGQKGTRSQVSFSRDDGRPSGAAASPDGSEQASDARSLPHEEGDGERAQLLCILELRHLFWWGGE